MPNVMLTHTPAEAMGPTLYHQRRTISIIRTRIYYQVIYYCPAERHDNLLGLTTGITYLREIQQRTQIRPLSLMPQTLWLHSTPTARLTGRRSSLYRDSYNDPR